MQQTKRIPVGMSSLRLAVLCLAAISVSLPMAWISLAKLCLLLTVLLLAFTAKPEANQAPAYTRLLSPWLVLASILLFALSLCWTEVNLALASTVLVKHSKLILLLAFVYAIRNRAEAATVLKAFIGGQLFVLLSSWMLGLGLPLPWVLNDQNSRGTHNVVFSESYLDQSIMMAALAGVLWQLRSTWKWPTALTLVLALLALLNPVVLLEGRTGQVAGFCVLLLALFWALPKPWRTAGMVVLPLLLALVLALGSERISSRFALVYQESVGYAQQGDTVSSSGWRINAWHRSLQAIAQQPVTGHGVGSFTLAVKRLDEGQGERNFGPGLSSNPHQEFLLWGVELGIGGILLLLALFASLNRDAGRFDLATQRAMRSSLAVTVIACLFNSALYDAQIGDYLCTLLGILLAVGTHGAPAASPANHPAPTP